MNWLAKAQRKVSEVGLLYALQQTKWTFLPEWLAELNIWNVNTIDIRSHAAMTRHDPALRWATNRDIPQLLACGVKPEVLAYAFGKSTTIAVYERDGRIVGYGQYAVGAWDLGDWLRFRFAPRDFHTAEVWVAPDLRGQGIGPKIFTFATSHFARNGYHRTVAIINVLNRNSIRACAKVCSPSTERFWYLRLFGVSYVRYGAVRGVGRWARRNRFDVMLGDRNALDLATEEIGTPTPATDSPETDAHVIPFPPRQAVPR